MQKSILQNVTWAEGHPLLLLHSHVYKITLQISDKALFFS